MYENWIVEACTDVDGNFDDAKAAILVTASDDIVIMSTMEDGAIDADLVLALMEIMKNNPPAEPEPEPEALTFNKLIANLYTAAVEEADEEEIEFIKDVLKLLIDNDEVDNFLLMAQNVDENGIETLTSCMEECLQLENAQENLANYLMMTPMTMARRVDDTDLRTRINLQLMELYGYMLATVDNPTE
jgi:hypothetical protein